MVHPRLSALRARALARLYSASDLVRAAANVAAVLTTIAMAALGLGVDVRTVAKAGPRVTIAVTLRSRARTVSYALIRLAGIA